MIKYVLDFFKALSNLFMEKQLFEIIKALSIILLLSIPPWIVFRGYIKDRLNRAFIILIFIVYMVITLFTENFMPFVLVMISIYLGKKYGYDEEDEFYLRPLGKRKILILIYSLVFSTVIRVVNLVYALLLQQVFNVELKPQDVINIFLNNGWGMVAILLVISVVFAPVVEEFIFRHVFYKKLSKRIGIKWSAVLSSLLFTLLHFNIAGSISFFAVGMYNCYLYEKHGYRAAVLNHFIFNFTSTIFIILIKAANLKIA